MKVENWNDPKQNVMMLKVGSSDIELGEVWLILINQSENDVFFRIPEAPLGRVVVSYT